jgi:ubiquinone/menaquinone biosynthesis C-methylase UbiE
MHPKLLYFRHKLFRYRQVEQRVAQNAAQRPYPARLLDLGCGDGENLLRFANAPLRRVGLEVSWPRLRAARKLGLDVLQSSGVNLPFPAATFDMVYVAHVLHHVADYEQVLAEVGRCLANDGHFFLVETVTDSALLRLGRWLHPVWQGDQVEVNWRYAELMAILQKAGYTIEESGRYNIFFFLWEMVPLALWPLELFTPLFIYLDLLLERLFPRQAVHCYFVLRKRARGD